MAHVHAYVAAIGVASARCAVVVHGGDVVRARALTFAGERAYLNNCLLPRYEAVLSRLDAKPMGDVRFREMDGVRFAVDEGPPRRVAFLQHGFVDNWVGVVHDPSGQVEQAMGWRVESGQQQFTAPASIRTLFGGDLVSCRHFRDRWYICTCT